MPDLEIPRWAVMRRSFDTLVEHTEASRLSFAEEALLRDSHWRLGEDARLREDIRFRPTPWGRWIAAGAYLANDALFAQLHREPQSNPDIEETLAELDGVVKRRCVFCPGDPRFVLEAGALRLSARELTNQPLIEDAVGDLEKYVTHLPVHGLKAAAASLPAGEWGKAAQEEVIEPLGWVRVAASHQLNNRMFVAQIAGHSMDNGRSGLVDGGYAIFELWPAGTKQNLSVLVRGAFSDPETGHYAVKKYVADKRDAEGRHHRITLVSLNPDKDRYPDIELAVENDDDLTVVAKVVQALAPAEFARRPRPVRRPGRRDLTAPESVAEIAQDLAAHTEHFFAELPADGEITPEEARTSWRAALVCLDAEAGGLHIEAGPLVGLWSFVKQLRVRGAGLDASVLASNLRLRPVRVRVPPGSGPWKWEAVGFEDDPDIDFSLLAGAALPTESVAVFRVDAAGVGRQLAGRTLSIGRCYRLLLPEVVLATLAHMPPVIAAGAGWGLWEVEIAAPVPAEVLAILRELDLELGLGEARLDWVLVPPAAWGTSPKGVPYPRFLASPAPVVTVDGPEIESVGTASLFLYGPNGHQVLPLPSGHRQLARLQDLAPGRYALMVLHDRTDIPPERLAFEVIPLSPPLPPARWAISVNGAAVAALPTQDLAALDPSEVPDGQPELSMRAPPGWPVRVLWRELAEDHVSTLHADSDGIVDASAVLAKTSERRVRRTMGDLVLDFAELGAAIMRHERRPTPAAVQARIEALAASRAATVQHLAGNYAALHPLWFEPVCSALGYDLEAAPIDGDAEAPTHVVAYRLLHTERRSATIDRHPVRVLLLVEDLSEPLSEALLAWIDELCAAERLRDVIISDGLRWAGHRRASRLALQVWDLATVTKYTDEFVRFLHATAEGV